MRKSVLFLLTLSAALRLVCSCTEVDEGVALSLSTGRAETKVVRLSDEVTTESFLVKFVSVPDQDDLDAILASGVESVTPLFHHTPGKEELEAQFGLDRWYEVTLGDDVALEAAIYSAASLEQVATVEYNAVATRCSDLNSYPAYEAEPQSKADGDLVFDDPYLSSQWHYRNQGSKAFAANCVSGADVDVYPVWEQLCCGDPSIIVAVVDEGVKYSHPDLADNMWVNEKEIPGNGIDDDGNGYIDDIYGYNFVRRGDISWSLEGDSGHATHCAGTIAAVNNNGKGVSGIAGGSGKGDGCRIMSCQVFSGDYGGSTSIISNAVKYAADNGASIISCSFGYSSSFRSDDAYVRSQGSVEIDAIHYFEACSNNGVLDGNIAIFASGNEAQDFAHYPGAFYDIISVSAFAPDMLPTYFTNYGPGCNIAAPGGELGVTTTFKSLVLSTLPSEITDSMTQETTIGKCDYGYMQGTSMACPHVSGVVALALSYARKLGKHFGRDEFKQMVLASTNDIDQKIGRTQSKSYNNVPIKGTNSYYKAHADLSMAPFYHKVGTGALDAWRLMMAIEGTGCSTVTVGKSQWVDLSPYFGSASVSLTYLGVDVPQSTVDALGLQKISATVDPKFPGIPEEGYAVIQYGRLYIYPTKTGSGKLTISVVGGGDHVGGGSNPPGGMEIDRQISIVARETDGGNGTGGWL